MRKATFEVPSEVIGEFTEKMTDLQLDNSIVGRTDDDEIEIEVSYEKSESKNIDELEAYLEELKDDLFEDEEEEEEEEEDDK